MQWLFLVAAKWPNSWLTILVVDGGGRPLEDGVFLQAATKIETGL